MCTLGICSCDVYIQVLLKTMYQYLENDSCSWQTFNAKGPTVVKSECRNQSEFFFSNFRFFLFIFDIPCAFEHVKYIHVDCSFGLIFNPKRPHSLNRIKRFYKIVLFVNSSLCLLRILFRILLQLSIQSTSIFPDSSKSLLRYTNIFFDN